MNQARSPFAQAVLQRNFPEDQVSSLGISAIEGSKVLPQVIEIGNSWGIPIVQKESQNLISASNKIIDADGNVKDRLIQQENLMYYANLECSVTPRTKLALGVPQGDNIQTVSVGKINFLNPGFKDFLDTNWSDELTGKDTLQGKGVNQININAPKVPVNSDDYYVTQTLKSNGDIGATDNGLLGITQINITYGTDFLGEVNITMEDVKGRALFEAGNNSPYAAFFNLPYPVFYLTLIYTIIQLIDGNILVPLLFSEAVKLHPISIIIAVIVFGSTLNIYGVFFAIPFAIVIKAIINIYLKH